MFWTLTLEDARVNDLAVICITHTPFAANDATYDESISFNNIFGYRKDYKDDQISIRHDNLQVEEKALTIVDEFINSGGHFVCWLSGHNHYDNIIYSINHPNQLMVVVGTAHHGRSSLDSYKTDDETSIFYDRFNYIGIDLEMNILKIIRIGKNLDTQFRPCNVLYFDLSTQKVILNL